MIRYESSKILNCAHSRTHSPGMKYFVICLQVYRHFEQTQTKDSVER